MLLDSVQKRRERVREKSCDYYLLEGVLLPLQLPLQRLRLRLRGDGVAIRERKETVAVHPRAPRAAVGEQPGA